MQFRPICQFGSDCYRTNPKHRDEYFHPTETANSSKRKREVDLVSTIKSSHSKKQKNPQSGRWGIDPSKMSREVRLGVQSDSDGPLSACEGEEMAKKRLKKAQKREDSSDEYISNSKAISESDDSMEDDI